MQGAIFSPSIHGHNRTAIHGSLRNTTTTDGGSADIAYVQGWTVVGQCRSSCRGANICPSIHGHSSHRHPWLLAEYRPSMDIKKADKSAFLLAMF
jgi:hypothetical protein